MRELREIRKGLSKFLLFILLIFLPSIALADWTIEEVDTPKWFTDFYPKAIALDSLDRPHIAYGGDHLYHAYFDGLDWQYEIIDNSPGVGQYASIAIDSNDKVHISYFDGYPNYDLKYATNASGSWVIQTLDSADYVGLYSSVAVDSNNKVHISYFAWRYGNYFIISDLKYATNASGSWVIQTLDSADYVGLYTSLAVDSNDKVHISYYDGYPNYDLKYATNASGSWVIQTLDSAGDVGLYTSIAVDSNNYVHISYYDDDNYDLKYATNASGSWVIQTLDSAGDVGVYASIAVDSNDNVHISYCDRTNYDLKYATNASGSWVIQTLDSADYVGVYASIAVDSNNYVHISYYDGYPNYDLKYATNASGSWVIQTLDSAGDVGLYTSIAVDSNDKVHISYYDRTDYDLKYATNASGSWVIQTLDSAGDVGLYTSIAVDSNDKVHISYYDDDNYDLKYATNASGSWVIQTLDSAGDVGEYTSIAVDSNNYVHISYSDYTNHSLKYATNASGPWVISTVDNTGMGEYTSIAVDSNDKAHISYYSDYNYSLKYATNASGPWVIQTLESAGDEGLYASTSIAVDSNDKMHISYVRLSGYNHDLQYATNASGSWIIQTLSSIAYGAGYTSIAVDLNNKVHISYIDNGLKYTTNTSGLWVTQALDDGGAYSSIAIHSNEVHIGYYANYHLRYVTNEPMCGDGFCDAGEDCVTCQTDCGQCTTIGYSPTDFSFTAIEGESNPPNQTLSIWNAGDGTLTWSVNDSATWLSLTPTSGTNSGTVTVSVNIAGLGVGTYNAMITVTGRGASPVNSIVTLTINPPPPTIGYSPTNFSFTATQGESNPPSQTLSITNTGGGTLNWSVSDNANWLSLSPASGTGSGTVIASVDIAGLTDGTYNAIVTITAESATNSPVSIPVTLTINLPPPPPPMTIISPNGGEGIASGSTYTIQWSAPPEAVRFQIGYSLDNGAVGTWKLIANNVTDYSYNWTVPTFDRNKKTCRVGVRGYNASGTVIGTDTSDNPFTIEVVKVTSPNVSGLILLSGYTYRITWQTNATIRPVGNVVVYGSPNQGLPGTWKSLAFIQGNPGYYDWIVPIVGTIKDNCRIGIVLYDSTVTNIGQDMSDYNFRIVPLP